MHLLIRRHQLVILGSQLVTICALGTAWTAVPWTVETSISLLLNPDHTEADLRTTSDCSLSLVKIKAVQIQ